MSLKIQLSSLLTSNWNCVKSLMIGFRDEKIVGVAPLLRSAMMFAANWSASCIAFTSLMPSRRFCRYRARTTLPVVNPSTASIKNAAFSETLSMVDIASRPYPLRLWMKVDAASNPSAVL